MCQKPSAHDGLISLERQILLPMFGESPIELGITGHDDEVLSRFKTQEYKILFKQAFPKQEISFDLIVKALSSFVRSLISLNSPFDQYAYTGDDNAISESALRGMDLFFSEKLECHHCAFYNSRYDPALPSEANVTICLVFLPRYPLPVNLMVPKHLQLLITKSKSTYRIPWELNKFSIFSPIG